MKKNLQPELQPSALPSGLQARENPQLTAATPLTKGHPQLAAATPLTGGHPQLAATTPFTVETPKPLTRNPLASKFQALSHGPKDSVQEAVSYLLTGGATTLVNYVVYLALLHFNVGYLAANTIAWVFAVAFAYVTNRTFVFHSENQIWKELASFVSMRFLTLLMENALLALFIQYLKFHPALSKIAVSFATVIANYAVCKCQIFRKPAGSLPTTAAVKGEEIHE